VRGFFIQFCSCLIVRDLVVDNGMMAEIAVVTGAGAGIGKSIARRLADGGFFVVGLDIDISGIEGEALDCDVSDFENCERVWELIVSRYGVPKVLVNNAGVILRKSLLDTEPAEFWRVMQTNLGGVFHMSQLAARSWVDGGIEGRIVNISSGHAWIGGYDRSAYASSKAAIEALTRNSAVELGQHGILVNAVSPGFTYTEMSRNSLVGERKAMVERRLPIRRIAEAEEVAQAVFALVTDQVPYMTGQTLRIDGGWSNSDVDYSRLKEE
jgi:NAD(P)-dependent dehydrogenase (short-subunit alcohol dehydrogenase family)